MSKAIVITAGTDAVAERISGQVVVKVTEYLDAANQLLEQAQRAVVDSDQTLGRAGDLDKVIRGQLTSAEGDRKKITAPVRDWVSQINALFKRPETTFSEARSVIGQKATRYQKERERAAREEAERQRKIAEEEALRAAEIAQSVGDDQTASDIMDIGAEAAQRIEKNARPELVRGDYGSSVGSRRQVTGEVSDIAQFLTAVASGAVNWQEVLMFKQAGLNALARDVVDNGRVVPGFVANADRKASFG